MNVRKYKIVLPSMVTCVSILFGTYAIFNLVAKDDPKSWALSAWLIIFAVIMDGLDGKVARLTKTSSEFGIQFDSIADIITFGTAATVLIYRVFFMLPASENPLFFVFPVFFLICGAIRLARFNTTATTKAKSGFIGLPIPTAAGFMAALFLFFRFLESQGHGLSYDMQLRIAISVLIAVSVLMVSQVKFSTSGYFFFGDIKKHLFRSILNAAIFLVLFVDPGLAFFLQGVFYILYGLGNCLIDIAFRQDKQVSTHPS